MSSGFPPIKFGTDGWRAVIAREYTFKNVERVAQAFADYLNQKMGKSLLDQLVQAGQLSSEEATDSWFATVAHKAVENSPLLVIVGYDCRFMSELFAQRTAEVLSGNRLNVYLFDEAVPTPLISWAVKDLKAAGGVVITASHNPPEFNGFKIKAPWGGSETPATTALVERLVDATPPNRAEYTATGRAQLIAAVESYRRQIANYIDIERLRRAKGTLIVDPMHGSGGKWVESFLGGGNLKIQTIRANRDPLFDGVNPEPIDRNLSPLKQRVIQSDALAGVATDGDADRVGAVNELGETMTMHDVVPLILLHLVRNRNMSGGVVRTFSQSVLLKRMSTALGLKLYETPIGFKYIAELIQNEDILIGAEESGGIGVKGHIPERDGILNSLLFLEAVLTSEKPPSGMLRDLHREFGEFHFGRTDLQMEVEPGIELVTRLAENPPLTFAEDKVIDVQTVDGTKLVFGDDSWLLFRQSGTEPVLRIYAESTSKGRVNKLLLAGQQMTSSF